MKGFKMQKLFLLFLICASAIFCFAAEPKVKIQQATPQELIETYFSAIVERDSEALWKIVDPELKKTWINHHGTEEQAKKEYWEALIKQWNPRNDEMLKKILNAPNKAALMNMIAKRPMYQSIIVQKNKMFYLNPEQREKLKQKQSTVK